MHLGFNLIVIVYGFLYLLYSRWALSIVNLAYLLMTVLLVRPLINSTLLSPCAEFINCFEQKWLLTQVWHL